MRRDALPTLILALAVGLPAGASAARSPKAAAPAKPAATGAAKPASGPAKSDSSYTLRGGKSGTAFQSMTIEGEDRVRIKISRPPLDLAMDPHKAPGLSWGTAQDVLERERPDLETIMPRAMATQPLPYLGRPWLDRFPHGPVARFRPEVTKVERWTLTVVDPAGQPVAEFHGDKAPPKEIAWDGSGVVPGLSYSYVFEAHDRAGNRRHFVGEGFRVPAVRRDTPAGPVLGFAGTDLADPADSMATGTPSMLLEAASWLNQDSRATAPIVVTARARTRGEAESLAARVSQGLAPWLLGDPARVTTRTEVSTESPEGGSVTLSVGN